MRGSNSTGPVLLLAGISILTTLDSWSPQTISPALDPDDEVAALYGERLQPEVDEEPKVARIRYIIKTSPSPREATPP